MKIYTVYLKKPISYTYKTDVFNQEKKKWEIGYVTEKKESFQFYSLKSAKKFIKENKDKYDTSVITQFFNDGDFENLGPINLVGSNKTFTANTKQKKFNY